VVHLQGNLLVETNFANKELCKQAGMHYRKGLGWYARATARMAQRLYMLLETASDVAPLVRQYTQEEALRALLDQARTDPRLLTDLGAGLLGPLVYPNYPHQLHSILYLLAFPRWALFLGLGSGKTKVVVEAFRNLRRLGTQRMLVVCPPKLLTTWARQVELHSQIPCTVLGQAGKRGAMSRAEKTQQLRAAGTPVVVTSYTSLVGQEEEYAEVCQGWMLVLDESTWVKNWWAARTQSIMALSEVASRVVIMSGEPYTRQLYDVFTQFLVLDGGETLGPSWGRFFAMASEDSKSVDRWGNVHWERSGKFVDMVRAAIQTRSVRYETADCVALPERIFTEVLLQLEGDQQQRVRETRRGDRPLQEKCQAGGSAELADCSVAWGAVYHLVPVPRRAGDGF
jgi:hypothetical protein